MLPALEGSLDRLAATSVDLYFVHFPYSILRIESLMDAMAEAYGSGKIKAVGVSNYNAEQMRRAAARLAEHGIALAANEVHYSLIDRDPEVNGVLDVCRELNVALVAYFPLATGMLKSYSGPQPLSFMKRRLLGKGSPEQLLALQETLQHVADRHGGTANQVALNWLLQRDDHVIAIPGATSAEHVLENAKALTWQLTPEEFDMIDRASRPWKP